MIFVVIKENFKNTKAGVNACRARGYSDVDSFTSHFQSYFENKTNKGDGFGKLGFDRLSTRYLNDLFEYVSSDEIVRLSQVSTVSI